MRALASSLPFNATTECAEEHSISLVSETNKDNEQQEIRRIPGIEVVE